MAEDIRQEFIIDAQKALKTLATLTTRYEKLNAVLRTHAKSAKGINNTTRTITGSLIQIKNAAKAAADQLSRVYGAKAAASISKTTKVAATGAITPVDTTKVKQAQASLEQLDNAARKLFDGKPIKNQKQFQRGLNELVLAFHRSGGSVSDFKKRLAILDQQTSGTAARMRTAMKKIQKSTEEATKTDTLRNFTVSWKTMVRIVSTQLIVRSLNILRQALRDAIIEATEFGRAVAEVGTIANDALGSLSDIAKIVRETSDAYGKSRLDVAEGLYQTLSNQVGTAAESLEVFEVANKLSITAVGSTEDAVNLLTAAINGFDISISEADVVAAKLFRTVELGRTRMSELANTLGRVGPLANALGVSLDETLAAIATITVQGTKSAEALTQLRGVMQGMLKPSEDMKKVFKEVGVASAEAGIATFGFQGFLAELTAVTGTSSSEMAKLIRRVRGLLGAITLAGEDTEKFIENIEKIEDTTAELLDRKFKLVFETPGEELLREFNKLKNILVVDIGSALVKASLAAIKFSKALSSNLPSLKALAGIIGAALIPRMITYGSLLLGLIIKHVTLTSTAVGGFIAQGGAIKGAIALLKTYSAALLTSTGVIGALALALAGLIFYVDRSNRAYLDQIAVLKKAAKAQSDYQKSLDVKKIDLISKLERKRAEILRKEVNRGLAEAQKVYNERTISAQEADKVELDSAKAKFSSMTDLLEGFASAYQSKVVDLQKAREDSETRFDGVIRKSEADRFKRGIRFLDAQKKLDAQRARGLKLQREASKLIVTGDPDKIQKGLELYREAGSLFEDIRDVAFEQLKPLETLWKSGELAAGHFNDLQKARRADNSANQLSVSLSNAQLKAETTLQTVLDKRAKQAQEDLERQKKLNVQFKSQFDIVLDNLKTLDNAGKILDTKTLADQAKARGRAFEEIRRLASQTVGGLNLSEQLQLASLKADIESTFSPAAIQISEDALNTASERVKGAFLQGMNDATTEWAISIGKVVVPDFDPARGFEDVQKTIQTLTDTDFEALKDKQKDIALNQTEINSQFRQAQIELREALAIGVPTLGPALADDAVALFKMTELLINSRNITKDNVGLVEQQIAKYRTLADVLPFGIGAGTVNAYADAMQRAVTRAEKISILRRETGLLTEEFNKLGGVDKLTQINTLLEQGSSRQRQNFQQGSDLLQGQTNILVNQQLPAEKNITSEYAKRLKFTEDINSINAAIQTAPATAQRQAEAGRRVQGFAMGGLVKKLSYFASGGFARGTDTIPAMLTKGEYVVNAKSTKQFYSQLVAMNSGRQPIYRQEGGPVTNISVGDINVQGGKNPAQTGRQIVGVIRRELRRGTSSF